MYARSERQNTLQGMDLFTYEVRVSFLKSQITFFFFKLNYPSVYLTHFYRAATEVWAGESCMVHQL